MAVKGQAHQGNSWMKDEEVMHLHVDKVLKLLLTRRNK